MRSRFALALLLICLGSGQVLAGGPQLTVDQPVHDFGEVLQGTRVEHLFAFRNTGGAMLAIRQVRSSCGCTAALLSASEVRAGGAGEVRASFDSGRFRGRVEKTITLYTNDPLRPTTVLRLQGRVVPELEADPADLTFGMVAPGESRKGEVTLINRGKEKITITTAYPTSPALQVQMKSRTIPPGESARLVVSAGPVAAGESLSGYLIVKTDSPRAPEVRVSVYGTVTAPPRDRNNQ